MSIGGNGQPVAVVTGAAGTVGRAVVTRLRRDGHLVAGIDLNDPDGDLAIALDVTDRAAVAAAAERARRELGPITALVTSSELYRAAPAGTMPEEQWRQLLATHLGGTVNALTAVVPGMVAAHRGTVVTTSSWLALAGLPGETYYAAATGTVLALTKSFAVEIAPHGVRMNCVAVGPLATGDTQETPVGGVVLPLGRYATADDVAATVEFLIHEGDFYVGQIFEPSAGVVV